MGFPYRCIFSVHLHITRTVFEAGLAFLSDEGTRIMKAKARAGGFFKIRVPHGSLGRRGIDRGGDGVRKKAFVMASEFVFEH